MLAAVKAHTESVIALGREGKEQALPADAQRCPHTVATQANSQTNMDKADCRKRKWIVEPPNGWIKSVLRFRQFSTRGLKKAQTEFKLVCMALNLYRMGATGQYCATLGIRHHRPVPQRLVCATAV